MKFIPIKSFIYSRIPATLVLGWIVLFSVTGLFSQPVTGVWRGKITRGSGLKQSSSPVEIKLVATADSILGTAYYYGSGKSYIRYSLKGYFDPEDGSVKWQDYSMIDMFPKNAKGARSYKENMKYSADYSCPDGKILRLDGKCQLPEEPEMQVELKKMTNTFFPDEWDEVIEGYYTGMNRKEVVDSVWAIVSEPYVPKTTTGLVGNDIAVNKTSPIARDTLAPPAVVVKAPPSNQVPVAARPAKADTMVAKATPPKPKPTPKPAYPEDITAQIARSNAERGIVTAPPPDKPTPPVTQTVTKAPEMIPPAAAPPPVSIPQPVMEQAFNSRKKIVQTEIPVEGDTLELRFYDNAEVDGDSISLFLNGKALFEHVRLGTTAYVFRLPINNLPENSELTMVAENLGAIPPNTAYMEAIVKGQRFTARLESTENSSGVVRLVKKE